MTTATVVSSKHERPPLNEETMGQALQASWVEDTCWPRCWDPENPAAGHCRVSAAVVNAVLGGQIFFAVVSEEPARTTHYWNQLPNGNVVDYTRSQFPPGTQIPKGVVETLGQLLDDPVTGRAFPILLDKVRSYFNNPVQP